MILPLTENYIASKFFQYCGKPTYNKSQKIYQGSCPICREGKSWGKKRRCYYIVEKKYICCHNCGWSSNPYNWITRVTGYSFSDIKKELEADDYVMSVEGIFNKEEHKQKLPKPSLPEDSINLSDQTQIDYYERNNAIKSCRSLIIQRRLDRAINKPNTFYTTLKDKVHFDRLIIPFYDVNNKIVFYQSRTVLDSDERPKYLSKVGSEKSLFGINNIKTNLDYIFITEGPIDAMFIENGVAVGGINESKYMCFTSTQSNQLKSFLTHKKIWVLDNQKNDQASKTKTKNLLDSGEKVFLWPKGLEGYKDINEYCISKEINFFDTDYIIENTYEGLKGKLLFSSY